MAILKPKVNASGLTDVVFLGVSKHLTERLMAPVVGNGTFQSGLTKGVLGGVVGSMGFGKIGTAVSGGMIVDGIEDIIVALMGSGEASSSGAWK